MGKEGCVLFPFLYLHIDADGMKVVRLLSDRGSSPLTSLLRNGGMLPLAGIDIISFFDPLKPPSAAFI
jgi:hypothetical protein